jgi:phosphoribosylformimino-5-aminoimidazole carboxamide ribotide isomerase
MLILPAIDLRAGECVRLLHGRFDRMTRYDTDPKARLDAFVEAGATWIHIVDLDGAESGSPRQHALIGELARTPVVEIQAGGGVRTEEDVERLLDAGASRVVIGSAAVQRPADVIEWLARFGPDRLTIALDVRLSEGMPMVAVNGWSGGSDVSLWEAMDRLASGSPRHLLVTDIGRDGAMEGPNLDLTGEVLARLPEVEVQASGGVSSLEDLRALKAAGAPAVIVGRALYEGRFTLQEAIRAG